MSYIGFSILNFKSSSGIDGFFAAFNIEIGNLQDEAWDFDIPTNLGPGQRIKSTVNWFKENW